jgi:uncharacterized repeat protein (TIGR01451 family)
MMIRRAVGAWFLVAFAVFCVGTLAQPYSLSSSRATTTLGSSATSVWADVTDNGAAFSVSGTIPGSLGTGNVLVMASFSANTATAVTDTAQWRLSDGTNTSNVILRTLSSNTNDQGIATVTWLFTGVTGTQTYHLQHKTLLGNGVRTHHATLVALPLAVSDGGTDLALNAGSDNTGTYEYASASATGENVEKAAGVDLSAAVSLPRAGRVFVAASLNCRPAAGASLHVGEWDLQVDGVTISVARRTMQAAGGNDRGAVTLYGLAEGLAAGTHNATVVVKSVSGQTIVTLNAVVVAVALSFDDDGDAASYYELPAWVAAGTNAVPAGTSGDAATKSSLSYAAGSNVFLAASYYSQTTVSNTAQNGLFRLHSAVGDPTSYSSVTQTRSLSGSNDVGSGGSLGLATGLAAGTYSFSLEATSVKTGGGADPTLTTNARLVGIGLTSAAVTPVGSIGDWVFNESTLTGINNVTVDLYLDNNSDGIIDAGDTYLATQTTYNDGSFNGTYRFTNLMLGDYLVTVTDTNNALSAGYALTTGTDPHAVTLTAGAPDYDTADFGYSATNIPVTKTASIVDPTIGQTFTYTVTVTNNTGGSISQVKVTDDIPANLVYLSTSSGTGNQGGVPSVSTTSPLVFTFPNSLAIGETAVADISVRVDNSTINHLGTLVTNTASVTYGGGTPGTPAGSASASVTLTEPHLSLSKTVQNVTSCSPPTQGKLLRHAPDSGDTLRYTVTITNGTSDSSTGFDINISDTLPTGLSYVANSTTLTSASATFTALGEPEQSGQTLIWGRDQTPTPQDLDLGVGETVVFTYEVTVDTVSPPAAGTALENLVAIDWTSLDGVNANERDGVSGDPPNDYRSNAEARVTTWDEPTDVDVTGVGTVADDGTVSGAVSSTLNGSRELILHDTASLTVTGDGVPATPFGTPSVAVLAGASAVLTTDGTDSFRIDRLTINAGATLELAGDTTYTIGSLIMGVGSTLILPDTAALEVVGSATIAGSATEANHARFTSKTPGGGYTLLFGCSVTASYVYFDEVGAGYVQFDGPTGLDHAVFAKGTAGEPYIRYTYGSTANWTYLSFDGADGRTVSIENTSTETVTVNRYFMGPPAGAWIGGDASEAESPGQVDWLNATPARDLIGSVAAPATGGILATWTTALEDGVYAYRLMRQEGMSWIEVGRVLAEAEPFQGASYECLDRSAPVGTTSRYRVDVLDTNGSVWPWPIGEAMATAAAPTRMTRAAQLVLFDPALLSVATLTRLDGQVASYATDTPTQTGTARKATVGATGLYQAPDTGTLYNVGQELPRLNGDAVFVRALSDFYTDDNVLWAGHLSIAGTPGTVPPPSVTAICTAQGLEGVYHVEEDASFTVNPYLPPGPNWFFSRNYELRGGTSCPVALQIAAPLAGTARITVNVRATSLGTHDLGISINGTPLAKTVWQEPGHYRIEASFPADLLLPGANTVYLQTDTLGSTKRLDYVEIQTPIQPALRNGDLLVRVDAGAQSSLTVPGAKYAVDATEFGGEQSMDVTGGTVTGLSAGQLVFLTDTIRTLDWGEDQTLSVDAIRGADYVAIAPAEMLPELNPLLEIRRDEGRRTVAVSLADAQDIFGGGLFGPAAVARLSSDISPTHLLLGAGTTYDYKRNEGAGTPLGIPCGFVHVNEGMAASDDLYTNGYRVAVGRLPARTSAELANIVAKIVDFAPGRRVALLSDADDTGAGLDRFAQLQRELADIMPSDLIESTGRAGSEVRADLIQAIRGGDKVVAYQGHGGTEYLGYDGNRVFGVEHCGAVPPSAWLLSTCLTGTYIVNDASLPILSHRLLTTSGNGAVSVLCSTRYGDATLEQRIVQLALTRMSQGGATWGDILLLLKREIGETETGQVYTLLGDPALQAVDLDDPREIAILKPNAGDMVGGGGKVTIRFRLLGEGWAGETVEVMYRRDRGNWVRIALVETQEGTMDYEIEWSPPDDGMGHQIGVREVLP